MPVSELDLALDQELLLAAAPGGSQEAPAATQLRVGDVRCARLLDPSCGLCGAQWLHDDRSRAPNLGQE